MENAEKYEELIISLPSDQYLEHLGEFISSVSSLHQGRLFSESSWSKAAKTYYFHTFLCLARDPFAEFYMGSFNWSSIKSQVYSQKLMDIPKVPNML